jgi:pSer/pThr/pTyr-binding forkhead associated (FHA) protein
MKIRVLHSETQAEIKQLNLAHLIQAEGSCFVGRSQASGLSLDSPNISRLHGKFSRHDGQYYFCDLGSSNGSLIQGEMAVANQEYLLQPGQIIRLGDFVLLLGAAPEVPEELPATVMSDLDRTVIAAYANPATESSTVVDDNGKAEQVIEAEIIKESSSALVKLSSVESDYSLQTQTKALFTAINQRILSELRAAGNLSRDTYLKAIRRARASIEQERLIDPEQFEKEAEKQWQTLARNTSALGSQIGSVAAKSASNLSQRLGAAAKAAWSEFLTHRPNATQQLEAAQQDDLDSLDQQLPNSPNPDPAKSDATQN